MTTLAQRMANRLVLQGEPVRKPVYMFDWWCNSADSHRLDDLRRACLANLYAEAMYNGPSHASFLEWVHVTEPFRLPMVGMLRQESAKYLPRVAVYKLNFYGDDDVYIT
jgi:hypothetical protein